MTKKEIKNRAVEVLKKFGRYQRQAGVTFSLTSSGNFSELPKHQPSKHFDKLADNVTRKVSAEQEMQYYFDAINLLSREEFKYILKNKFLVTDKLSNLRLQYDLQIGKLLSIHGMSKLCWSLRRHIRTGKFYQN